MMIALYWSRSDSRRLSLNKIPSVMYLIRVDCEWEREREREGGREEEGTERYIIRINNNRIFF